MTRKLFDGSLLFQTPEVDPDSRVARTGSVTRTGFGAGVS
jgi:hypothetical protein